MGKTISAYFVFCDEHRAEARIDLLAETGLEKISVAQVAKALGEKWKNLPDDERKRYKDLADKKTAEARDQEGKENADPDHEAQNGEGMLAAKAEFHHPFGFPLSLVKRIMTMDDDVHSISSDALKVTAKTAALLVEMFAVQAAKVAAKDKRKTVKFADVQAVLLKDKRWELTGIKDILLYDDAFLEARQSMQDGGTRAPKPKELDPKARQITNFFKA